jgi:hypothetical protein
VLALPNNVEGAAPLTTNDATFAVDSTFLTGATDFPDSSDSSVPTYSIPTTDTSLMSGYYARAPQHQYHDFYLLPPMAR